MSYSAVLTALERSEAWEAAVQLLEALRVFFLFSERLHSSMSFSRSMETHLSRRLNVSESTECILLRKICHRLKVMRRQRMPNVISDLATP